MDSATLHNNPHLAAQEQLLDDGNGKLELWRVTSTSLQKMNSGKNLLYSAESYIIHYTYIHNDAEKRIVYYWKVFLDILKYFELVMLINNPYNEFHPFNRRVKINLRMPKQH